MCASECQMDKSSKAPYQKRSIPLVCELGLLERRFAKLEADEDYGEALQACARERFGARQQNWVLLKYTATGRRYVHLAASDSCGDCRPSLLLPSSLTSLPFLSILFFLSSFHIFYCLHFFFFTVSLFFSFYIFFISLPFFSSKPELVLL